MKQYAIMTRNDKVYSVQTIPNNKLDKINDIVQEFNNNQGDCKASLINVNEEMESIIDFLLKKQKIDKDKLLDSIKDLSDDLSDLQCSIDDTFYFIKSQLEKEKDNKNIG